MTPPRKPRTPAQVARQARMDAKRCAKWAARDLAALDGPASPDAARIPDGPALDALATALRPWVAATRSALVDRKDPLP